MGLPFGGPEVREMKKMIISLCIILALISFPFASYAGHTKAGALVTTPLLGASLGMIAGAFVLAFSSSSSTGPIAAGAVIGFGLGLAFALFSSPVEGEAGNTPEQSGESSFVEFDTAFSQTVLMPPGL